MSAPWPALGPLSVVIGAGGLGGLTYATLVIRRARRQTSYEPVWEDWLWYASLPCFSYALLVLAAALLGAHRHSGLFVVAASALLLLLVGIHNAWDTVTHIVITDPGGDSSKAG